ncbi:hypothetical protein N9I01_00445 [bacterium]|nr:hypothetical protein [bacterium]
MELSIKQGEAVIKLHDIARFVESNLSIEIGNEIREIAHRLDHVTTFEEKK